MTNHDDISTRLALGAAAGFTGTMVLQGLRAASARWWPATMPPVREDPGEYMVARATSALPAVERRVPSGLKTATGRALGLGYGMAFGALYGLASRGGGHPVAGGVALGLVTWAAGYLGWLQTAGLLPPIRRQGIAEAAAPVVRHAAYGVATAAAYDRLRRPA